MEVHLGPRNGSLVINGKMERRMRALSELVDPSNFGRQLLDEWLAQASNSVELLTCSEADGARCLEAVQVTSRSPMGALAHSTGGMLVDEGWIRVLGAGGPRLTRSLASWNSLPGGKERLPGALLVGDDAIGGFFALNGGRQRGRTWFAGAQPPVAGRRNDDAFVF